ncbi:MAG: DsbC family protein [Desulfobacteraceae bacterium]|nr:MAG: DsbC family protein [Desulfobacteraceae bacterium]
MRFFQRLIVCFTMLSVGCFMADAAQVSAQCPTLDKIKDPLKKLFSNVEPGAIQPTEVKGICQVQVKLGGQIRLLYVDGSGEYFLAGNLVEAKSGRNLTMEATQLLNRLGPEDLRQLEALTAFTLGKGDKVLYFVTDPQCPYCKQAEAVLKKMAEKGELTVRFIFFPLPSHKGAKEQCISILCDKKGLEGLEKGYKSENQCAEGVKKVEESLAFLQKKGISSTPTFIFSDGIVHPGLLPEEALRQRLGLPPAAPKTETKNPAQSKK